MVRGLLRLLRNLYEFYDEVLDNRLQRRLEEYRDHNWTDGSDRWL